MITGFTVCRLETTGQSYHWTRFSRVVPAKQLRQKPPALAVTVDQGGQDYVAHKFALI